VTIPDATVTTPEFGVYVHIPFCTHRCDYCAFATWTDREHLIDDYLQAVRTDIERTAFPHAVSSVFVGGGTPSLVSASALVEVLEFIPVAEGAEVTVECNPDDVDVDMVRTWVAGGVTRVSIGVQSMTSHVLGALGRRHVRDNVARAVDAVIDGGATTFNLDLIYGAVGERDEDWLSTLEQVVALGAPHISAYALTVEAGTPLADRVADHPDDDVQASRYEIADDILTAAGLENYEISNWARPGHECRHNLLYWAQGDYLGVGCAAHSHRAGRRWWNLRTPERYVTAVTSGESTEASGEILDAATREFERLELALRTRDGVPLEALDGAALPGLVERRGDMWVLTRNGRLLANDIATRLRVGSDASG